MNDLVQFLVWGGLLLMLYNVAVLTFSETKKFLDNYKKVRNASRKAKE